MCGVVGIVSSQAVNQDLYNALTVMQHRGQDAAGIITYDGRFHIKKGEGLVRDIFSAANMERLAGSLGVGHVRYPTVGGGEDTDVQPFWLDFPVGVAMAHNGNITNALYLRDELVRRAELTQEPEALLRQRLSAAEQLAERALPCSRSAA